MTAGCRFDRMVELLLAPHPQPSGPRGVARLQCHDRADADGARHLQDARAHPWALLHRGGRVGRRAGGRPRHQQAARPQPGRDRIQARPSLRHQSGGRRSDAGRDRGRHRGVLRRARDHAAIAVGISRARGRLRHGAGDRVCHEEPFLHRPRAAAELERPSPDPLRHLRASVRDRGHGALPGLFRADLLAVLLARNALPRLLQAAGAHLDPGARRGQPDPARLDREAAQYRHRPISRRAPPVRRRDRLGAVARLLSGFARFRRAQGGPEIDAVDGILHSHHHRRRRRLAVRSRAGQPSRGRRGEPPADRSADERDRGPQAHRRQAAEGQGACGSCEQRQEPSRRGLKPRVAHAAQCHPGLFAIAGTRPGASVAAGRRRQGRAPERGAPVGADRRAARHIEDRSGTLSPQPQRGAHRRFPRAIGGHVQPAGDRQGRRVPLYPVEAPAGGGPHR